jgi:uncharacterized metal-binding protein
MGIRWVLYVFCRKRRALSRNQPHHDSRGGAVMSECSSCKVYKCKEGGENLPSYCPGINEEETLKNSQKKYTADERKIAVAAAAVESEGYAEWSRVREIMEFAHKLGYQRIGLAFCVGLREEARVFADILRLNGFETRSAICKAGSVDKSELAVSEEKKLNPGKFEAMCNPIAQADLLDKAGCQLNVILGLCVGHDTLFIKHSKAPVTVLAVKDRVLAHNPLGALYAGHYYHKKLKDVIKQERR